MVAGIVYICRAISHPYNKLFGLESTVGLTYLQIGLLNILCAFYGSSKAVIRFAAVGINVLSLGLIVWMIRLFTKDSYNFFLLGIMTTMAIFSLFNKRTLESETALPR